MTRPSPVHTTDNQGTTSASLGARLVRDVRLAGRLVRMVVSYLLVGGRVRRRVRTAAARGEIYRVDHHHPRSR